MVSSTNVSYQPAAAYQGGQVNTPQQEPRSGQTQPRQAPAADTQHAEQRTRSRDEPRARNREAEQTQDSKSSYHESRGKNVDVRA